MNKENINHEFLRKFIPPSEYMALQELLKGEERGHFIETLVRVQKEIEAMPLTWSQAEKPASEITVGMHYFLGASDWWLYELDPVNMFANGFVCLNGDTACAELGGVDLTEIMEIGIINLDLYWDTKTNLSQLVERVTGYK